MPDLNVVAVITAKTGSEPIVESALKELAAGSKHDRGCLPTTCWSRSRLRARHHHQQWQSQEDIDADMAGPHAKVIAAVGDHFERFPAIHTLCSLEANRSD